MPSLSVFIKSNRRAPCQSLTRLTDRQHGRETKQYMLQTGFCFRHKAKQQQSNSLTFVHNEVWQNDVGSDEASCLQNLLCDSLGKLYHRLGLFPAIIIITSPTGQTQCQTLFTLSLSLQLYYSPTTQSFSTVHIIYNFLDSPHRLKVNFVWFTSR